MLSIETCTLAYILALRLQIPFQFYTKCCCAAGNMMDKIWRHCPAQAPPVVKHLSVFKSIMLQS